MNSIIILTELLSENKSRLNHSIGVYGRMQSILPHFPELSHMANKCSDAALLHDIGYSSQINTSGFHPFDGYNYLTKIGYDKDVCLLVLLHSFSKDFSLFESESVKHVYDSVKFKTEITLCNYLLTYCDLHTSPNGNSITCFERLNEIRNRLGEDSTAYSVLLSNGKDINRINSLVESRIDPSYIDQLFPNRDIF